MIEIIGQTIINIISSTGYLGIFFLMFLESALIPIPSEVTMPFAGSLVNQGRFAFLWLVIIGAFGNLIGSLLAYCLGFWGDENVVHTVIKKYGKYVLVTEGELEKAEVWFRKYGEAIVFTSRVLPVIRTFISLPAGIAKMNLRKFIIYTLIGSLIWSALLTYIGFSLGSHWNSLEAYFRKFDLIIFITFIGLIILYFKRKFKKIS